jgi:uncharacterized protein (TIGR02186 family)
VKRFALVAAFTCALVLPARAEQLAVGLTEDYIRITSNFTGADIVLFGAIQSQEGDPDDAARDLVIVIRGPEDAITVRRKDQVGPIWINTRTVTFDKLPGFYFLATTRPLNEIAAPAVLDRYQLGGPSLRYTRDGRPATREDEPYEAAIWRAKSGEELYVETIGSITLIGDSLFQVKVPMPANVPIGNYRAEAFLFRNGQVVSAYSSPLYVDKSGLERFLFDAAHDNSWAYGIAVLLLAALIGWGASAALREPD